MLVSTGINTSDTVIIVEFLINCYKCTLLPEDEDDSRAKLITGIVNGTSYWSDAAQHCTHVQNKTSVERIAIIDQFTIRYNR